MAKWAEMSTQLRVNRLNNSKWMADRKVCSKLLCMYGYNQFGRGSKMTRNMEADVSIGDQFQQDSTGRAGSGRARAGPATEWHQ